MLGKDLEYVGFWPRVGAFIIDGVILSILTYPLLIEIYGWDYFGDENNSLFAGPSDFLITWIFPAVATILFWLHRQATPGKMAFSARVVDAQTGKTISTGQAIGRYLAYFASMIPLFIGIIWVAFDPKKQGWHDKLAGTVVVRLKNKSPEPVDFGGA